MISGSGVKSDGLETTDVTELVEPLSNSPVDPSGSPPEAPPSAGAELVPRVPQGLVAALRKAETTYRDHTRSEATVEAYAVDWGRFEAWARGVAPNGLVPPLPLASEIVAAYLGWLADEGFSNSTITRFLSAAAARHKASNLYFARDAPVVRETLKGIRRRIGTRQTKKAPLGLEALAMACKRACEEMPEARCLRARAMLTVGWFCMLRSANLVAIRRDHIRFVRVTDDGGWVDSTDRFDGFVLHLPESKTDQLGEGREIAVYAQDDETVCPARALKSYIGANSFKPDELIFPVSEKTVTRLVKHLVSDPTHEHESFRAIDRCAECSEAASRFGSHSLRRGSATTLAQAGVSERDIMRQGGWKNERVMRGYIEQATIFQNNPTKGLTKK